MPISQKIRHDFEVHLTVTNPFNDSNKHRHLWSKNNSRLFMRLSSLQPIQWPSSIYLKCPRPPICLSSCQQPGIHPFREGKTWMESGEAEKNMRNIAGLLLLLLLLLLVVGGVWANPKEEKKQNTKENLKYHYIMIKHDKAKGPRISLWQASTWGAL